MRGRSILSALAGLYLAGPLAAQNAQVDRIFAAFEQPGSPGCALGVARDGRIIYERGYGLADLEWEAPISPTTVFNIGSVSKQFVAAAIVLLAEEGKLSLDDDVRKHLTELPAYERPITIRHLLHHTSGIRDLLELMVLAGQDINTHYPNEYYLSTLARQKELNFSPGSAHLYSNSGYVLLAMIVQRASGQSLRQYADQRIFKPLGMLNTHFHDDNRMVVKQRAQAYAPRSGGWALDYSTNFDRVGSGGVNTTIRDLALWDHSFTTGSLGGPGFRKTMLTRGVLTSGDTLPYALALVHGSQGGLATISHGGSSLGFRAMYLRFPEQRLAVFTLCNTPVNPALYSQQVASVFLGQMKTEAASPQNAPPLPVAVTLEAAQLSRLAGQYRSDEVDATFTIALEAGQLVLRGYSRNPLPLVSLGPNRLRAPIGTLEFEEGRAQPGYFRLQGGRVRQLKFSRIR